MTLAWRESVIGVDAVTCRLLTRSALRFRAALAILAVELIEVLATCLVFFLALLFLVCINTSSLRLKTADLMEKILPAMHHTPRILPISEG